MVDRYAFSLTTFSPNGKLGQLEYALAAVNQGVTSVGIKAVNGVVVATEKKSGSPLVDETTIEKVSVITSNIGLVYSGMGPDARVLLDRARKAAQAYKRVYHEEPPTIILVREIASVMQDYTQSGGVRPFGVSLLISGFDESGPALYQVDPSGTFWTWKASAIGKNMVNAKTFLEKRYSDEMDIEDAIYTAILTLKEGQDSLITENAIEIGVSRNVVETNAAGENITVQKFKKLSPAEIKDYISNISH